jgi:uncharacterized protein
MTVDMNTIKEFEFLLFSLKDKVHEYSHTIGKEFFIPIENSPIEEANFNVGITLKKSESLLQFEFNINGTAQLTCDRSLDLFDYPIQKTSSIVFKFGEAYEEVSDDMIILEQGTAELNVSRWIYELIAVEIPYKKLHPRFEAEEEDDEDWDEDSNIKLVYSDEGDDDDESESSEVWEELKKKFNKE